MATFFATSYCSSSFIHNKSPRYLPSSLSKIPFGQNFPLSLSSKPHSKRLHFSVKAEKDDETSSNSSSSAAVISKGDEDKDTQKIDLSVEGELSRESEAKSEESENQQEVDWKLDDEFKKFMGNPSIEAAIKLEKKRADRKLKELDRENSDNPIVGILNRIVRDNLSREKERLEKAEEAFKALDLNKVSASLIWFKKFF